MRLALGFVFALGGAVRQAHGAQLSTRSARQARGPSLSRAGPEPAEGSEPRGAKMVSSEPEFPLRLSRVDGGTDQVLLQVYDPERLKWVGWGLFELERDGEGRAVGGKVVFRAPREGEWKLRAVARSADGRREEESETAFEVTAVYDATPPRAALWCERGVVVWASSEPGSARLEARDEGVWVELGRDLPSTGSLSAPLKPGQRVRLTVFDEAGNASAVEAVSAGPASGAGGSPVVRQASLDPEVSGSEGHHAVPSTSSGPEPAEGSLSKGVVR